MAGRILSRQQTARSQAPLTSAAFSMAFSSLLSAVRRAAEAAETFTHITVVLGTEVLVVPVVEEKEELLHGILDMVHQEELVELIPEEVEEDLEWKNPLINLQVLEVLESSSLEIKDKYSDGFREGDYIVVQEKIDGANFSIRYNEEEDAIASFSRKNFLNSDNNLRGAWNWAEKLDKELVKEVLGTNLVLFGEWLCSHTIVYPTERYQNAYFYDVYDVEAKQYLEQDKVKDIVNRLGLIYVPVFYEGEFISWEHLQQFVGRTDLGGENGEGIVVKNMTRLNDPNTRLPFYTKIVADKFSEKKSVGKPRKNNAERDEEQA